MNHSKTLIFSTFSLYFLDYRLDFVTLSHTGDRLKLHKINIIRYLLLVQLLVYAYFAWFCILFKAFSASFLASFASSVVVATSAADLAAKASACAPLKIDSSSIF